MPSKDRHKRKSGLFPHGEVDVQSFWWYNMDAKNEQIEDEPYCELCDEYGHSEAECVADAFCPECGYYGCQCKGKGKG